MLFTYYATEWRIEIRRRIDESDTEANTKAINSLLNYETVKYFGAEAREAQRYDRSMERYERASVRTYTSLAALNAGQAVIFTFGLGAVMVMCAIGVRRGTRRRRSGSRWEHSFARSGGGSAVSPPPRSPRPRTHRVVADHQGPAAGAGRRAYAARSPRRSRPCQPVGQHRPPADDRGANPSRAAVLVLTSDGLLRGTTPACCARRRAATCSRAGMSRCRSFRAQGHRWNRFRTVRWSASGAASPTRRARERDRDHRRLCSRRSKGRPSDGGVDEIHIVYTEFVSMLTQRPVVRRVLPLEIEETRGAAERAAPAVRVRAVAEACSTRCCRGTSRAGSSHALLDSAACEIAARRRAMKSATDNANELIERSPGRPTRPGRPRSPRKSARSSAAPNALAETIAGSE